MFGSRDLNEALKREPYHTRSVDEITAKASGYDCFYHSRLQERLLDGSIASRFQKAHLHGTTIWQIPMDPSPNGYSCGTGHFQSKLDAIFIGMNGVTGIADDMIIAGKDEMEHDRNFQTFMEKCMKTTSLLMRRRSSSNKNSIFLWTRLV